ncbi:hypothetical protein MKW98_029526 [Papaver atlanticum]|uniref:SKP1-like protein n=1 Tax=Papaver atlanticum TaxID=357466 RepID=A0AAD4XFN9_9MAGN|nr:hypothetical protein MKW98_029526 [Papaver atlanticum]
MAAAPAPAKMITSKSSVEQTFVIEETVALQSKALEYMIAENETEDYVFPLPNVTGSILAKVIEYCRKHAEVETSDADKQIWDAQFVDAGTNTKLLTDLIMAANFLNIMGLIDLASQTVADMIRGKTPEQVRQIFNIFEDFTPEEDAQFRRENQWAFE